MATNLMLDARTGLPDDVAYLRAAHPREGWRAAPTFGQLADFWLGVHAQLRQEGAAVEALTAALIDGRMTRADFPPRFVAALNRHLGHLDMHHRIEDQSYFPEFRALDVRMAAAFDLLEADHAAVHRMLEETVGAARGLLSALVAGDAPHEAEAFALRSRRLIALLDRHLADEEEIVIPAMLVHGERALA